MPETNLAIFSLPYTIYTEFDTYKGKQFRTRVKEYVEASPDGSGVPVFLYIDDPSFNLNASIDSMNLNDIRTLPVYSSKGESVKVEQVIDNFALKYDFSVIKRFNRQRYMMIQCEPVRGGNTMASCQELWKNIQEQVAVPEGYVYY